MAHTPLFNAMPTYKKIPQEIDFLPKMVRSKGLHVSEQIKKLGVVSGYFQEGRPSNTSRFRMLLGCAFEDILASYLCSVDDWIRPGEMIHDGIYFTPDLLKGPVLGEVKLSFEKTKHPRTVWYWNMQIGSYCHGLGLSTAHLFQFSIASLELSKWELEFNQQETKQIWELMKGL